MKDLQKNPNNPPKDGLLGKTIRKPASDPWQCKVALESIEIKKKTLYG